MKTRYIRSFPKPRVKANTLRKILLEIIATDKYGNDSRLRHGAPFLELSRSILRESRRGGIQLPKETKEETVRKALYAIRKDRYIKPVKPNKKGGPHFALTKKGEETLHGYSFTDMRIPKQERWDGKWRFVVFDVPEKHRYARNMLRDKIKRLGFFQVQQSVWAFPYPCEQEIELMCEYLYLESYVLVLTSMLKKDNALRAYFRKQGLRL